MLKFTSIIISKMIKQLKLQNYILIDELTANFDKGLNIITGETGAGKSIIINAIDLIFAPRVSKDVIKTGADKAVIEITLENHKSNLYAFFSKNGIDDWGSEIVISKEITPNSVRSRINGTLVNTEVLSILRSYFIDIHSQHQTYAYMHPKSHIVLLDSYGKNTYGEELNQYKTIFNEYKNLQNEYTNAKNSAQISENQLEFLKFQINEIESAEIKHTEEDVELKEELEVLENAEKLKELTASSYWALNGDDNSILDALNKIKNNISKAASYDNKLIETEENFTNAIELLKDNSNIIRDYSQNLTNDEQRLNEIQERLYIFDKLKHKYGNTLADVLETYKKLSEELNSFETSTQNIEELQSKINQIEQELKTVANSISNKRQEIAQNLSQEIQNKLEFLELPKSRFKIEIREKALSDDGIDEVEFMISTNISEDLKPLAKTASGGEVSRVMLAIKSIFAQNDNIDTVIFDEIDTGISGKASQSVADEIHTLSKYHQIILITHQAIIASKSDKHFYVKKSQDDITKVEVYVLTGENKLKALAELAGGEINDQSIEFAKSLIYS